MNRKTWRNIFIGIILLTIPCYIVGIVFWFTGMDGGAGSQVPIVEPSRTPIDVDQLVTERALTNPALVITQTPLSIASPTSFTGVGVTPIVPTTRFTNPTTIPFFTSTPLTVNTAIPTNTQQIPTNTPFPTATPIPAQPSATPIPSNTPQVLLPPTDTPSP